MKSTTGHSFASDAIAAPTGGWLGGLWRLACAVLTLFLLSAGSVARADDAKPDQLIDRISQEVLAKIKADKSIQSGDFSKISALVDETIMPHVNFKRMTALAVGRPWRSASAEQRAELIKEFRILLLRTYSGALSQFRDEKVRMKRMRASPEDTEVIVRSEIIGRGDPIQLNYRLEKHEKSWRIFDLNVLGVWLVSTYRNQFKQIASNSGVDGLIGTLKKKNLEFAKADKK